jgi:hypothetical protein
MNVTSGKMNSRRIVPGISRNNRQIQIVTSQMPKSSTKILSMMLSGIRKIVYSMSGSAGVRSNNTLRVPNPIETAPSEYRSRVSPIAASRQ